MSKKIKYCVKKWFEAEEIEVSDQVLGRMALRLESAIKEAVEAEREWVLEEIFKKLVREEGRPVDKDSSVEDWETTTLSEVVEVLDSLAKRKKLSNKENEK